MEQHIPGKPISAQLVDGPHCWVAAGQFGSGVFVLVAMVVVAPVFTEEVDVVVVVVSLAANGDKVGSLIGEVVGDRVAAGEDVPQPFATLISTSAQFLREY